MNKFGMVYMSTVGCGIVYMDSSDGTDPKPTTTTTATTTTTTTTTLTTTKAADTTTTDKDTTTTAAVVTTTDKSTTTSNAAATTTQDIGEVNYGDVNVNGVVDLTDAILLNKYLAKLIQLTDIQYANANCDQKDGTETIDDKDTSVLMKFILGSEDVKNLPYVR